MFGRVLPLRYLILVARPRLRRVLFGVLAIVAMTLCGTAVALGIRFAATTADSDRLFVDMAQPIVPQTVYARVGPKPLVVESTALVAAGSGTFDVIATVKNPSKDWALRFVTYTFSLEGAVLGTDTAGFFPQESRTLTLFSIKPQRISPQAEIDVAFSAFEWRHVKNEPRLALIDVQFAGTQLTTFAPVAGKTITRVTGTLENRSFMDFAELSVIIVVRRSSTPVGVGRVILSSVAAGESRAIDFRFPTLLDATRATLEAAIPLDAILD